MVVRYVAFLCSHCGTTTQRDRNHWHPKHKCHFCSQKCRKAFQVARTMICLPCGQCGSPVTRSTRIQRGSKSGHLFCDTSCAAKYNNAHKTWGIRRSKLEVWLEDKLRSTYPNLDILCNDRTAINGELDFYFPSLKLAFELNGVFHYEPIYGGPEKLTEIQNNDARKMAACLERGIELCVVDTSQSGYFKPKVAEKFLVIVREVLDKVIDQRLQLGWEIGSIDPTKGRKSTPAPSNPVPPQPHFLASMSLEKSLQWMDGLQNGTITRTELSLREKVNPSRISQLLNLVYLPEETRTKLLSRDPSVGFLTTQKALQLGRKTRGLRKPKVIK